MTDLLKLDGVSRRFVGGGGREVQAVDRVSITVPKGGTLGIVGESGSGKSTLGKLAVRLLEPDSGTVEFDGLELDRLDPETLRSIRRRFQYVFQDPLLALNPRRSVGDTIAEPLLVHGIRPRNSVHERVAELLDLVELPGGFVGRYPFELSGGELQRVGIARALAVEPELLVLDEPVSALDVSVRAQLLALFTDLRERLGLTYIFISHDLGVVVNVAAETAVMYAGRVVEKGPTQMIVSQPAHPYTEELVAAVPSLHQRYSGFGTGEVTATRRGAACSYFNRCRHSSKNGRCHGEMPELRPLEDRTVACHHAGPG